MKKYIKSYTEEPQYRVLWYKGNWEIFIDGYGVGVSDGYTTDRPAIYERFGNTEVAYGFPERIPKYVKNKMNQLVKSGAFDNPDYDVDSPKTVGDTLKYKTWR